VLGIGWFAPYVQVLLILGLFAFFPNGAAKNTAGGVDMLLDKGSLDETEEMLLDRKLKESFETAKKTLEDYYNAKSKLEALHDDIMEGEDQADGLGRRIKDIKEMKERVAEKTESIDKQIRDINAQQILDLKGKVEELRQRELQRRAKLREKEERIKKRQTKLEKKRRKMTKKNAIPEGAIKKNELRDLVDVKSIVMESDEKLKDWCVKIVEEEVAALQEELEEVVIEATTSLGELGSGVRKAFKDSKEASVDCSGVSMVEAVQLVQESLVKFSHDAVGMADHLAKATVVHFLTSDNFVPASKYHNPIEDMWWFQHLPDDWERGLDALLPKGWKQWNIAIPDYVYHSIVSIRRDALMYERHALGSVRLTTHLHSTFPTLPSIRD
jgi:hypothetical protein